MSDKDFDLHRPTTRREVKRFEPPPWEREAFEELQRRKAEQEQVEQAGVSAQEDRTAGETPPDQPEPAAVGTTEREPEEGVTAQPAQASEASTTPGQVAEQKPQVPEHVVIEMMAELSAQEPSIQPAVHTVSFISALTVAAIGTVMILWGMAALVGSRTTGAIGAFGGAVLLLFGSAAIAGAVWLAVRTLRQRGVL